MLSNLFSYSSVILKIHFSPAKNTVTYYAEISGVSVVGIRMGHDWLLPIREFVSLDGPMDLFHIPSRAIVHLPMHVSLGFFLLIHGNFPVLIMILTGESTKFIRP